MREFALIVAVLFRQQGPRALAVTGIKNAGPALFDGDPEWSEAGPNPATIKIEDIPAMLERFKNMKKWSAWTQCLEDRAAGKAKHCYENDSRWR
jgi:hypothetical protein